MLLIIALSFTSLLVTTVSGATQVDVKLGPTDFFLGEQFIITVSDVIYWLAGMCMGIIFAITFLVVSDFQAFQRKMDGLEDDEDSNTIGGSSRGARLIGPEKYPTRLEERMLSAIHTDPSNYFEGDEASRQGRLIGSRRLPTGMEQHVLKDLSGELDNKFENLPGGNQRQPRLIGPMKYPTQMEDHFLRPVDPEVKNMFD